MGIRIDDPTAENLVEIRATPDLLALLMGAVLMTAACFNGGDRCGRRR